MGRLARAWRKTEARPAISRVRRVAGATSGRDAPIGLSLHPARRGERSDPQWHQQDSTIRRGG